MIDRGFAHKAIGKPPERMHHPGNRVGRQEEDGRLRRDSPYLYGRAHAIHHRHVDVQDYDVRLQLGDFLYGFFAIRGLAANLERMLLQKRAKGGSHQCGVVDQKDASSHRSNAGGAGWGGARLPQYVLIFICSAAQYGNCRITFSEWRRHLLLEDPTRSAYAL
jgi:hypothetical protein